MNYVRYLLLALMLCFSSTPLYAGPWQSISHYFDRASSWALSSLFVTKVTVDEGYSSIRNNLSGLWSHIIKAYGKVKRADENLTQAQKNLARAQEAHETHERHAHGELRHLGNRLTVLGTTTGRTSIVLDDVKKALNQTQYDVAITRAATEENKKDATKNRESIIKIQAITETLLQKVTTREPELKLIHDRVTKEKEEQRKLLQKQQEFSQEFNSFTDRFYKKLGKEVPGIQISATPQKTFAINYHDRNKDIEDIDY